MSHIKIKSHKKNEIEIRNESIPRECLVVMKYFWNIVPSWTEMKNKNNNL